MSSGNHEDDCLHEASTHKVIGPLRQPGYYPAFSTLAQQKFWDAKTRAVILDRVHNIPPIRFFSPGEAHLLEVICDHLLPQADRAKAHQIPIVPWIDQRLFENRHDGYRFADMPPDQEAFRLGFQAIELIAHHSHNRNFLELSSSEQNLLLKSLHDGQPAIGEEIWRRLPVHRFWMMLMQDCIDAYYAHPWAWDEIGFGGPAYPRAYIRLEHGSPEPWEADEKRYAWKAPASAVSDLYEPLPSPIEHPSPHPK